jgi:hypothetical protein
MPLERAVGRARSASESCRESCRAVEARVASSIREKTRQVDVSSFSRFVNNFIRCLSTPEQT